MDAHGAYLERELARGPWCLGETFSVADLYLYMLVGLGELHPGRLRARRRARARALPARRRAAGRRAHARARRSRRAPDPLPPGAARRPADLGGAGGRYRRRMAIQHATAHPLEPLAPAELERAAELVRAALAGARFVSIGLHEPPKADYLAWLDGGRAPAALRARDRGRSRAPRARGRVRPRRRRSRLAARSSTARARRSRPRTTRPPPRPCAPTPAGARRWRAAASTTSRSCRSTCSPRAASGSRSSAGRRVARAVAVPARGTRRQRLRPPDREPDRLRRRRRVPRARARGDRRQADPRGRRRPTPPASSRCATTCGRSRSRSPRA